MAKKQHIRPAMPLRMKMLIPVIGALILCVLAVCLWPSAPQFPRLEVAGFRIGQEEYRRAMYEARNDVLSDHAAAGISLTDWDAETALGDPNRMTMERALALLREYYAVGTLACERGYLADAGFEAMKRDMEEINRKRRESLDSGGVVTGFVSFTMDDYISYRASGIRLQFCNDPANPENQVTREEIRQRYEADRDGLYQQPDSVELEFVALTGDIEGLQELRNLALEKGSIAAALEEKPRLREYYQEISVTPENYSVYARSHGDILAYAQDLDTGDISAVITVDSWQCLIRCSKRTAHQYVPLEDVESIVIQSIRESRYDAILAERMENIQIRGDLEELYRFTAEQLR